ncbi:MAG: cytidylate kinase-like family protein [Dorea sp.]|jgi:cytidylate kinase|nr:cytidylate kinase-like family protein [Dorea sp.]
MADHKIITIGRQFGSGGHEIGNLLATRLDIPLYDNNLVRMVAKKLDIREETARAVDETTLNNFLAGYVLAPMEYSRNADSIETIQPLNEQVYELQTEIIRKLAKRGPCVIVGRCADYVLKDYENCIDVFICADKEERIKRIAKRYDMSKRKAVDKIAKVDRERRYYYESHTGQEWGSKDTHQIVLNASRLGIERMVDVLEMIYKA